MILLSVLWILQYSCLVFSIYLLRLGHMPAFFVVFLLSYVWLFVFGKYTGLTPEDGKAASAKRPFLIKLGYLLSCLLVIVTVSKGELSKYVEIPFNLYPVMVIFLFMNILSDLFIFPRYIIILKNNRNT